MKINSKVGSVWLKWDLHAHTPLDHEWLDKPDLSTEKKKRDFAKKYVESALRKDLSVIAITDHNFCDEFENLLIPYIHKEASKEGITILPGFELTIKEGKGVHILTIFPENTDLKVINTIITKVLPGGNRFYGSSPVASERSLNTFIDILEEFKRSGKICDFLVAFAHANNKNGALHDGTIKGEFRIRLWKNNKVKLCQLSKSPMEFEESFIKQIYRNETDYYNRPDMAYFAASDCRSLDENTVEGRYALGEKFTWIKAKPTFAGLKQAINEPKGRFAWSEPELLKRVRNNPEKFIDCLRISWEKDYKGQFGTWFKDIEIPFNKGLVAIIGNKGNGKSAIADIIGLCANSKVHKYFSFLNRNRFLKPKCNGKSLASNFRAELIWENREKIGKNLQEAPDNNSREKVRYLPQNYFEKLSADPSGLENFKLVLEQIVFEHLPQEKRYGKNNLKELAEFLSNKIKIEIQTSKESVHEINKRIIDLEVKETPEYLLKLENDRREKLRESKQLKERIRILENKKVQLENLSEQKAIIDRLKEMRSNMQDIEDKISKLNKDNILLSKELKEIINLKEMFNSEITKFRQRLQFYSDEFKTYNVNFENVVKIGVNIEPIEKVIFKKQEQLEKLDKRIHILEDNKKPLIKEEKGLFQKLSNIKEEYEKTLSDLEYLKKKRRELFGENNIKDSLLWLRKEILFIKNELSTKKEHLERKRISLSLRIFNMIKEIEKLYREIKKVVDNRLTTYKNLLDKYGYTVKIEALTDIKDTDFKVDLLSLIDKRTKTIFKEEGEKILDDLIAKTKFSDNSSYENFLMEINKYFHYYQNEVIYPLKCVAGNNLQKRIENLQKLYDFIFNPDNYLEVTYELRLKDKNLDMLSPGERGAILLIFYLLLDIDDIPLIIDQPEENLDNESIYKVLVKFIRDVKKRRQVIIITHNPNLAIVADADQIIRVKIDRKNYKFSYESGAIEDHKINKFASDILEGTLEAFGIREEKYFKF